MLIQLKSILRDRLRRLGHPEKIELGLIQSKWPQILEELARGKDIDFQTTLLLQKSFPDQLRNGILTIKVESDILASELSLWGQELIERLNREIGRRAIKRLFFKIKDNVS